MSLTREEKYIKHNILFYTLTKAMKEAEVVLKEYEKDPLVYVQDKEINNLCHVILRLYYTIKSNHANIFNLTEGQKWQIYREMKAKRDFLLKNDCEGQKELSFD